MYNNSQSAQTTRQKKLRKKVQNATEEPEKQEDQNHKTKLSCEICKKRSEMRCSRCQNVFYCCAEHQKQDWKKHKVNCIKLVK